ncbi:unnamed protein product [Caenorhabditis bovis]|uniref:G-protein coupled receptors family 1 profile domain-containing protein n=1 Tax=Caenorhabditis bovis TaxID=2654633 RepID=A0A8S1EC76_9PELO|nr:unnamed protein product [Caenorhabditis bovis]
MSNESIDSNDMFNSQMFFDMKNYNIVTDVLPPPNHEDLHVMIMAVSYLLLFLLGTCGNVAVLTTIYHVVRSSRATLDNTLIYVIVLSCVDFGVCLSLPITVIDQILGFWMFGSIPCKLHAVFENFGKILSALILTAMSFDRYAGVCHPQKKFLRSRKLAITILLGPGHLTRMRIEKCTIDIQSHVFTAFTIYQFVFCYCTPLVLIAYFYIKLLSKLREHTRTFKSSQIPFLHISLYTLAVACFYFLCWTPFWMATVFAVYLENSANPDSVPPVFVYIMYFIHALPFTNSAINWILYGALNSQLQQRCRNSNRCSSTKVTNNASSVCHPVNKNNPLVPLASCQINESIASLACATANTNDILLVNSSNDEEVDTINVRLLHSHNPTFL